MLPVAFVNKPVAFVNKEILKKLTIYKVVVNCSMAALMGQYSWTNENT